MTSQVTPNGRAWQRRQQQQQQRRRQLESEHCCIKVFLDRHRRTVDFLSATLLIGLCLIVLLPIVHNSFLKAEDEHHHSDTGGPIPGPAFATSITDAAQLPTTDSNNNATAADAPPPVHDHAHHHHDPLPVGEFLVCAGFFVFYCVGFSLDDGDKIDEQVYAGRDASTTFRRRSSTRHRASTSTCCSSIRCPPSGSAAAAAGASAAGISAKLAADELTRLTLLSKLREPDEDCVMLLNPHHQHHTHTDHHEPIVNITTTFGADSQPAKSRVSYGSLVAVDGQPAPRMRPRRSTTSANQQPQQQSDGLLKSTGDNFSPDSAAGKTTAVVVDEIRIISEPCDMGESGPSWPRSISMLLISLILTAFLVLFDMQMHGVLVAIKVFRACSTGALLYVAFFIMLPKDRASCNSCTEEEI